MIIRFWGVRGSIPAPKLPSQIRSKISAILERVTVDDLLSPETRERFLANLPLSLFGTVGGNSPCVTVDLASPPEKIVLDAGSGLREFGTVVSSEKPKPQKYHVLLSHFHWDHLQGLPFFGPGYDPSVTLDFYSPMSGMEAALRGQMVPPYFPVNLDTMASRKTFTLLEGEALQVGSAQITYRKMNHPGDSYSYRIEEGRHCFIYATDTELLASDFQKSAENAAYFENADVIVMDSQYTLGEAIEKYNWGHSAFSLAVDFAATWGIKHLVLFHHDPSYDDKKLFNILHSARGYAERMNIQGIEISLSVEGMEIVL